ncbi:peptidoglycan-associated lipoprotein Pal [Labrys wisconsinensis]|uniref:Peptidoglycan-associated lipoprotein n=1 Tax=Labrys wisconsinensis TaxID=425677 RepID=A0ABU0JJH1_9HYPH|nr:peptidoglycan-associated lipoprotein Pal [Labrys wisconsinensis]MDQ0474429.1 peptidoglycan-associated lipoprotein [Labrys wisconsinensis]
MLNSLRIVRGLRFVAVLSTVLALGACAKNTAANGGLDGAGGLGAGGVARPGSQQDFVVNVGDRVFFLEDQSDLTGQAQSTLSKQAQWLRQYPRYTITVEGHADERGTREYNIALGARRAQAVRDYLMAQGIPAGRMRTISYGKERPVATCNDESCWTQNRRAVTVLNGAAAS